MKRDVALKTPCCGRRVRPAFNASFASFSYHRTCPKCRTAWAVVVRPLKDATKYQIHMVEWVADADSLRGKRT